MKRPNFKPGQCLRTSYAGDRRDQVFRLDRAVPSLGGPSGGAWWCTNLAGGYETTLQVDSLIRVPPREVVSLGLAKKFARAEESVAAVNADPSIEVLARRAYPGLVHSGYCSAHRESGHYDCAVCYPDWQAKLADHMQVSNRLYGELLELSGLVDPPNGRVGTNAIVAELRVQRHTVSLLKAEQVKDRQKIERISGMLVRADAALAATGVGEDSPVRVNIKSALES